MKPRRPWVVVVAGLDSETLSRFETRFRERQDIIQVFMDHLFRRSNLTESQGFYDIERPGVGFPWQDQSRDLLQLGITLGHVPTIKSILLGIGDPVLDVLIARLDGFYTRLITSAIAPEASAVITEKYHPNWV